MYHCHLHFYCAGPACPVFDTIRNMPPLERFSHTLSPCDTVQEAVAAKADVMIANLQSVSVEDVLLALRHVLKKYLLEG